MAKCMWTVMSSYFKLLLIWQIYSLANQSKKQHVEVEKLPTGSQKLSLSFVSACQWLWPLSDWLWETGGCLSSRSHVTHPEVRLGFSPAFGQVVNIPSAAVIVCIRFFWGKNNSLLSGLSLSLSSCREIHLQQQDKRVFLEFLWNKPAAGILSFFMLILFLIPACRELTTLLNFSFKGWVFCEEKNSVSDGIWAWNCFTVYDWIKDKFLWVHGGQKSQRVILFLILFPWLIRAKSSKRWWVKRLNSLTLLQLLQENNWLVDEEPVMPAAPPEVVIRCS